jgi:hypothetical protein
MRVSHSQDVSSDGQAYPEKLARFIACILAIRTGFSSTSITAAANLPLSTASTLNLLLARYTTM